MKKLFLAAIITVLEVFSVPATNAQINVQINIGSQPAWAPTGYDYVPFYYFPDFNFYYDVNRNQYIIFNNNVWSYITSVPTRFGFDPYNAYKVVINQNRPYLYNKTHIRDYRKYKGQGAKQPMIRDSREEKYFESKQHPQHNDWVKKHPQQENKSAQDHRQQQNNSGEKDDNKKRNEQKQPNNAGQNTHQQDKSNQNEGNRGRGR